MSMKQNAAVVPTTLRGYRIECRRYLCLSSRSRSAELQMLTGAVQPCFDLLAEEIDRSGGGKLKNKWDAGDACVKVPAPAPDRSIVEPGILRSEFISRQEIRSTEKTGMRFRGERSPEMRRFDSVCATVAGWLISEAKTAADVSGPKTFGCMPEIAPGQYGHFSMGLPICVA